MTNTKELTRDIIAILVVLAAIAGAFITTNELGAKFLFGVGAFIVGFYFGDSTIPVLSVAKRIKADKKHE